MTITEHPDIAEPTEVPARRRRWPIAVGALLGIALVVAASLGVRRGESDDLGSAVALDARVGGPTGRLSVGTIEETVRRLEERVRAVPSDDTAHAALGLAYVEQARITGDATRYAAAESVLDRSLEINDDDNFGAYTGLAALAAARHDFVAAERFARDGLALNPQSATLHGILSDAEIQLGRYDQGFASVQRMADLSPDVAAVARAAYTHELRGDDDEARRLMQRAYDQAANDDERAFALFQLGEIALADGEANRALGMFLQALELSPDDISALSGKAHSLGAAGQVATAADSYEQLLERAPLADFMIEYGEFLIAHDRGDEGAVWIDRARQQIAVDRANGVQPDAGSILFELDHGDPVAALALSEQMATRQPFFEVLEAHAWALLRNGRAAEAATTIERSLAVGVRDAELYARAAIIHDVVGNADRATSSAAEARRIDPNVSLSLTASEAERWDRLIEALDDR